MNSDQWLQVKKLFNEAIDLLPEERAAFLQARCDGNDELLRELTLLLESHDEAEHFIEQPALASTAEMLATEKNSWLGRKIGPYVVLAEMGRGGMGVVLQAARADKQYESRVAIKLIKRGMDTDEILARFRNERQILANLDHPNIARLLDGGTTEDGLPYFVMEYIEGLPVDDYCEKQGLSIEERLQLFRSICSAVAYAHQHLVVHRDLKPGNILVTAEAVPKLLDFGISKLLVSDAAAADAQTATAMRVMTPEYASPEQVRGQTITTASDIYSLGVVLYELLTGMRPYRLQGTTPEEMSRVISDSEPPRPSQAIPPKSHENLALERAASSSLRPAASRLKGDLDNIVLMAIRKDPTRRYKSVEQFAEDIDRHLKGLPVRARAATLSYRVSKFIQRHRAGTAAAILILITLGGGVVATLWQARVARREQAKAEEIGNFLKRTLNYSNPVLMGKQGGDTTVTQVLDEAAKRLESGEFSNQPEIKAELQLIIAQSYNGQGKQELALKHFQESVSLLRQRYGEHHPKTLVASSLQALVLFNRGEMAEAETLWRRILPLMTESQKQGEITAAELALALVNFAYLRRTQGDSKEAETSFRQTLALTPQLPPDEWRFISGTTRSTLASTLADQGRFAEALQTSREAVAELRQRGEDGTPNFGFALTILGGFLSEQGDFAEADANLREAEAIFRKLLSPLVLWLGDNLRNQSISFYHQGKYQEALMKADEALSIYRQSFGEHYDHYPTGLTIKGLSLTRTGQTDEGERLVREAVKMRVDSLPADHFWVLLAKSALGECLTVQKRYAEAEPLLVESHQKLTNSQGAHNPRTKLAKQRLDSLYANWLR